MTHVHYKFSSKLSYDTVVFDGQRITLRDLKTKIMGREKLRAGDCDLWITNAQTREEYTDDEGLIPKGLSVIVKRIPVFGLKPANKSKTRNTDQSDILLRHASAAVKAQMDEQSSSKSSPLFSQMTNLADVDASEEDKIKVMINQSAYDSMNYNKALSANLPANYNCFRCGISGHHIRNCTASRPEKNSEALPKIRKSTGIPRTFLVEVDDPNMKGVMMTSEGHYAIPAMNAKAYATGKKERPVFEEQPRPEEKEKPAPDELLCTICRDLLSDAVVIPCCGNSYCDDCIRTALLDSEEHTCPTCGQSQVSPDTLIANKLLRQAVNTYKVEGVYSSTLSCATSWSQHPSPDPDPVPVPAVPPATVPPAHSQQDPLLPLSQTPALPQVCVAPSTATDPVSATPASPPQPVQSLQTPDKEAEEMTHVDSETAAPSVLVSHKDSNAAAEAQLRPAHVQVSQTPAEEQPQTARVSVEQSSSGGQEDPALGLSEPLTCRDSFSSLASGHTGSWSVSCPVQPPPVSSSGATSSFSPYPAAPLSLFASTPSQFFASQQPLRGYPPGYPPPMAGWTFPPPHSSSVPSLCSTTPTPLIPKEWYMYQRQRRERSSHRESSTRGSSSHSTSKSRKSKSSRSYSHSSSRSRSHSRSRSRSRSRSCSHYSRHGSLHTRSHSSKSHGHGHKRSLTPSSSSSPRKHHRSTSRSPSDHHRNHSRRRGDRHHRDKESSSKSSKRRRERSQKEAAACSSQHSDVDLDKERLLQWQREYREWFDKCYKSYISNFQHLHPPFLQPPPLPLEMADDQRVRERSETSSRCQSRCSSQVEERSPPPPQSASSSLSRSSSDSRSPPSQTSGNSRSSLPRDDARRWPETHSKASEEVEEGSKKHKQKRRKMSEEGRGEEASSPDAVDPVVCYRKEKQKHHSGPKVCEDDSPSHDNRAARQDSELAQLLEKAAPFCEKDHKRKSGEQKKVEVDSGRRAGKRSDSMQDVERQHKEKPRKETSRADTDRPRNPASSRSSGSRSEKDRGRKGDDGHRSSAQVPNGGGLKTEMVEAPTIYKSDPQNVECGKKEEKKERKTWSRAEGKIWEGAVTLKPQMKISIILDAKVKKEKSETQESCTPESTTGKAEGGGQSSGEGLEDQSNTGGTEAEGNVEEEPSRDQKHVSEEQMKPDKQEGPAMLEEVPSSLREDKRQSQEADFDLWHFALRGGEEEEQEEKRESKKQRKERHRTEASRGEEQTKDGRRSVSGGNPQEEMVKRGMRKEEDEARRSRKSRSEGPNVTVEDVRRSSHTGREEPQVSSAPSSGPDRRDSSASGERDGRMVKERGRDREEARDGQRERKRSREEERGRDGEKERRRGSSSSSSSLHRKKPPSSSSSSSSSSSHDSERRDRQQRVL